MWIQHLIIVCIVDDAIAFSHYNARTMHTHRVSPSLILTLSLFKSSIDIFFLKSYLMNWTCLYFYPNHVITFSFKPKINFMIFKLSANQSKKKTKKNVLRFQLHQTNFYGGSWTQVARLQQCFSWISLRGIIFTEIVRFCVLNVKRHSNDSLRLNI